MKGISKMIIVVALFVSIGFALTPKKASPEPCVKIVGDENINSGPPIPYHRGDRQSPGDSIGTTYYDFQANGTFGQRIAVDDYAQAHIDWMKRDASGTNRFCAWNARFSDGSYYGETQASVSWSGYVQLDVTRDLNPDSQRTVVAYHYAPAANYYSWIDIDAGNVWGNWPNNPKSPAGTDHIWPYVCVANNGNIVMATNHNPTPGQDFNHLYVTTNEGDNWTLVADYDSCTNISQFLRASHNPGSNKVVFTWTQFKTDTFASGQTDADIWYQVSTDGGEIWDAPVNLTDYQPYPVDSVRAYTDVNAIFDANDNLHIVWSGRRVTNDYYVASKIFHWDEVSDQISIVTYPSVHYTGQHGWWTAFVGQADPGAWRMPADQPQLVCETDSNWLYCIWHGQDDPTDKSAGGFANGDFYMTMSKDGGLTWTDTAGNAMYDSLTHTRSPGAGSGACYDEDYMTAYPFVVNDSIYITYIEDKDAGGAPQTEGTYTSNPVRCWVFPVPVPPPCVVEEHNAKVPMIASISISPNPAVHRSTISYTLSHPGDVSLKLFDVAGREIMDLVSGYKDAGAYNVDITTDELSCGTYFAILKTRAGVSSRSLVFVR